MMDPSAWTAARPAAAPANLTRSRARERALAGLCVALLHVLFLWLLNVAMPLETPDIEASSGPLPALTWVSVPIPGELQGRAVGEPNPAPRSQAIHESSQARHGYGTTGRSAGARPRINQATTGSARAEGQAPSGGDQFQLRNARTGAPASDTPAVAAPAPPSGTATDNNAVAEGAKIDWQAAAEQVAREIAGRYSNLDANGPGSGAAGSAPSGLVADGSRTGGRPECGKVYSGAAILGTGMWQYDGRGDNGCEWRR